MDGVLEMEVAYARRALLGRVVMFVTWNIVGRAVILSVHALSMGGVLEMGSANVRTDGWETCATSALQATSGPSARRSVMPRSIAARRDCVSATGAAGAWIRTAEQTAAGVTRAGLVRIVKTSVQGTIRVLVTGDALEMALAHVRRHTLGQVATSASRGCKVENAKRPVNGT